ncbi:hypothetical protein NBRC13296_12620 [Paenibacillus chitinolyticus]|uniref:hypothetical protein n=1 Tax=Paenibacillus chitinolyticus TaxID=79263 RepID=UPI003558D1A2
MMQFLLDQWVCDCGFEFYTKGYPDDMIVYPSCESSEGLGDGQTVKAERWHGENLE